MRDIAAYVEWRQSSHPSFEDLANELGIVDWLVEDCVKRFGVRKRKKSGKRRRRCGFRAIVITESDSS